MADASAEMAKAVERLDRALSMLETRMRALKAQSDRGAGEPFAQDRSRLAEELDQAQQRGKALQDAAIEASAALGRAAADVRAALGEGV